MSKPSPASFSQSKAARALLWLTVAVLLSACGSSAPSETPSAGLAERRVAELLQSLGTGDTDAARRLYSAAVNTRVTEPDLIAGLQLHSSDPRIRTITRSQVCEWGLFAGDGSTLLNAAGALESRAGDVNFSATLRKDEDGKWRLMGFILRGDVPFQKWGACT